MHSQIPAVTGIALTYPQATEIDDWWIPEGTVPQAMYHDAALSHLQILLKGFVERSGRQAKVARDLAIRYVKDRPRIGIDPDLCILDPPPSGGGEVDSLCLWKEGHLRPPLCIEIVSKSHPNKDYRNIHERYAWMHPSELVIFDPKLVGPKAFGGPVALQVWRRDERGLFNRIAFGKGPAYCQYLNAWLHVRGTLLEIADDEAGNQIWVTPEQRERAAKLDAIAERDRERALRLELEQRMSELEGRGDVEQGR